MLADHKSSKGPQSLVITELFLEKISSLLLAATDS